jgi:predicted AlkP superfamily phosphohydrolase/phosphomutase
VVRRKEEIFAGRSIERLPDVFIEFEDQPYDAFMQDYESPEVFYDPGWAAGTHRRNGLYIGAGPGLAGGDKIEGLEIFDIAPNILHLMGFPIPKHMDGRFRADLFAPGLENEPKYEDFEGGPGDRVGITDEEEEEMAKRLKGLGYL